MIGVADRFRKQFTNLKQSLQMQKCISPRCGQLEGWKKIACQSPKPNVPVKSAAFVTNRNTIFPGREKSKQSEIGRCHNSQWAKIALGPKRQHPQLTTCHFSLFCSEIRVEFPEMEGQTTERGGNSQACYYFYLSLLLCFHFYLLLAVYFPIIIFCCLANTPSASVPED